MTAEELLEELDDCNGECGKLCITCPAGAFLKDIRDVIIMLIKERDVYHRLAEIGAKYGSCSAMCEEVNQEWSNFFENN